LTDEVCFGRLQPRDLRDVGGGIEKLLCASANTVEAKVNLCAVSDYLPA